MARSVNADTVSAVRGMIDGHYGVRYVTSIARNCELPPDDARKALETTLLALLPLVRNKYAGDLLAHLTVAIGRALFPHSPGTGSPIVRYSREWVCIEAFVRRVSERDEPFIEDCLKAELFFFFLGEDNGPYRAALSMPSA